MMKKQEKPKSEDKIVVVKMPRSLYEKLKREGHDVVICDNPEQMQ